MLRELHQVLDELHDSVIPHTGTASALRAGVRLESMELTLPLDLRTVLRGGGCVLLADVARNPADASWLGGGSRLRLSLGATLLIEPGGFDD